MVSPNESGYEPLPSDGYFTPSWVTELILWHEHFPGVVWEPAPGDGHMVDVLEWSGYRALATHDDFFSFDEAPAGGCTAARSGI